jgi:predicted ATPase
MSPRGTQGRGSLVPRIQELKVRNYRALRDVTLSPLAPLTALLGPNGAGKSTVFDVFAFLKESFSVGLRPAIDRRGRFRELRSRGTSGPIVIEVKYDEGAGLPPIRYHLEIDEDATGPVVAAEWLQWRRVRAGQAGAPFRFLSFRRGTGTAIPGETPDAGDAKAHETLDSPDRLAVNTLGQFAKHPRVSALRRFITGWYLSYITADNTRSLPEAGPQERLSQTGDNLPNVVQYLKERHSKRLDQIFQILRRRVPRLQKVDAEILADGRLLLQLKDGPFDRPILARFTSDGTLKMLAYLIVLHDPAPPPFIGIEEPENHLHPRLLPELAEECRAASEASQIMVTTHSPFFLDGLRPEEVWQVYRDPEGYTQAQRVATMRGIPEFIEQGATLGSLWTEGHFEGGDPLTRSGLPRHEPAKRRPNGEHRAR